VSATLTHQLAEFNHRSTFAGLDEQAVHDTKRLIADTVAIRIVSWAWAS